MEFRWNPRRVVGLVACIDILMRNFTHAGGGRYMIWIVSPAPWARQITEHNRNDQGWYGIHKIRDTHYWGRTNGYLCEELEE